MLKQHTTVSTSTGKTPAAFMFGHELDTVLMHIQPQAKANKTHTNCNTVPRALVVEQAVFFRSFRRNPIWTEGTVLEKHRSWLIKGPNGVVRRHCNRIKPGALRHNTEDSSTRDNSCTRELQAASGSHLFGIQGDNPMSSEATLSGTVLNHQRPN